jgi:hypothetical protein
MARSILRTALTNKIEARLPRKPLVYLLMLLSFAVLMGGGVFIYFALPRTAQSTPATRADLFMQSVATRDGALGWHQLCPALQARLSINELSNQASEQKAADASQGITLTAKYLGSQTQTKGGEMRFYLVTAKRPDGWQAQRMYFVQTQPGGCVQDVQSMDIPGQGEK